MRSQSKSQQNLRNRYFKSFYKKRQKHGGRSLITGNIVNRTIANYKNKYKYGITANVCAPRFSEFLHRKASIFLGSKLYNYKHKSSSFCRFRFGVIVNTPSTLSLCRYETQSPLWYVSTSSSWLYRTKQHTTNRLSNTVLASRLKFLVRIGTKNIIAHAVGSYATLVIILWALKSAVILAPSGKLLLMDITTVASVFRFNDPLWIDFNRLALLNNQNRRGVRKMLFRNRRPSVRGTVKNPCDHPHGGRTRGILRPQTPWNKPVRKSKVYVGRTLTLRDML